MTFDAERTAPETFLSVLAERTGFHGTVVGPDPLPSAVGDTARPETDERH